MTEYQPGDRPPESNREWRLIEKVLLSMNEEQRKQRRWSIFFRGAGLLYLFLILFLIWPSRMPEGLPSSTEPHTGLVDLTGIITSDSEASADLLSSGLRRAFEAEHSKAVLLRINSPGGSPVQSAYVYREIKRLREEHPEKKLYAVITDLGASGAYYIASAADEIYVDPSSMVGSIGVIMGGFGFTDAIDKLGVERRVLKSGENKDMFDPFAPLDERHEEHLQQLLDQVHVQFIDAVKQGRGERLDSSRSDEIFSGLVWTGEEAIRLGLADGVGSPGQVAREVVGEEDIVDYSAVAGPLDRFLKGFGISVGEGIGRMLGLERTVLR